MTRLHFDLCGTGPGGEYTAVNLTGAPDILWDFTEVDRFAPQNGTVDDFRLSHTLGQAPGERYVESLRNFGNFRDEVLPASPGDGSQSLAHRPNADRSPLDCTFTRDPHA
jgi:hypothetical protein